MTSIQAFTIAILTTFFMATFSSVATFFVNRYAPRFCDHVEKHIKKRLDKK